MVCLGRSGELVLPGGQGSEKIAWREGLPEGRRLAVGGNYIDVIFMGLVGAITWRRDFKVIKGKGAFSTRGVELFRHHNCHILLISNKPV